MACLLGMLHVARAQDIAPANATTNSDDNDTQVGIFHSGDFVAQYAVSPLKNGTSVPV